MTSMQGKTVLITGATQGIGKAAAIDLAKRGADVVLVCRGEERGRRAADEVRAAGAPSVDLILADLASQAEVRRAANEVKARHTRLDVLLNNAGVIVPSRRLTVDGIEETFAINHLAYFLLTNLLLDLLKKSAPSRIVSVSSDAHKAGGRAIDWDDLNRERAYSPFHVYGQSKLCNILFTRELARRLDGTGVTANCLHPGVIGSGFGKTYGGFLSVLTKIAGPFMLTPEKGARTSLYLATSPEVEGITGKYFANCAEKTPTRAAQDDEAARRLWAVSEEMTGLTRAAAAE